MADDERQGDAVSAIQDIDAATREPSGSSYEPDAARVLSYELAACNTLAKSKSLGAVST